LFEAVLAEWYYCCGPHEQQLVLLDLLLFAVRYPTALACFLLTLRVDRNRALTPGFDAYLLYIVDLEASFFTRLDIAIFSRP
jgi:hypothetical protein